MKKVRYFTNWMGPVSTDWYRDRGLLKKKTITYQGKEVEIDDITEQYCCGRIDFWNNLDREEPFLDEMSLPLMHAEDWYRFSEWLETLESDFPHTLGELVYIYEQSNPRIRWWEEHTNDRP